MNPRTLMIRSAIVVLAAAISFSAGASVRTELTPQERALYVQQIHGPDWRSLNITQRCARMEQTRSQWRSMSPAARNQLKQQLAARWQTMPAADKQRIEQRIADRQQRRAQNSGPRRGARCAGANNPAL